ncbi:DUF2161 family putative PD-(D/E)XK-type phosphodiesterase [Metabacillus sp. GX 13764]|uniref:DUF2161 domain-containing phosphodiesterase n=1 Tax=Metabacillus kandeliae TaxID=2900151 RepID=UPI001E3CBA4C|nr:DUF2161 family putative PD-(D/E)XK-type phosphodiesterase [Metabacillus kandeliae]MCD7035160.1 DUF2161 family putative PD-(D/E)XK-type phosphodiesterase [Metabacillus kandeliae]
MKEKRYETDLYEPVRRYFMKKGFAVNGEVNHCDVTALKDDELAIIELKLHLNVELLTQAVERQRMTDLVYIAIPKPKMRLRSKKWLAICHLIKRLELGLILVQFRENGTAAVEVAISPARFDRKKSLQRGKAKRKKLLQEISGRNGDYNVGGSSKTKILTAYKENCIHIACLLKEHGTLSPKQLREHGTGAKTLSILNKNYYGWYEKVARGKYTLSQKGTEELAHFPEPAAFYAGSAAEETENYSENKTKTELP